MSSTMTVRVEARNDNDRALAASTALDSLTDIFELAQRCCDIHAVSMPSGMGKSAAAQRFASASQNAVIIVKIDQTGTSIALQKVIAAAAPSLFPEQPFLFEDDKVVMMPRVPKMGPAEIPAYLSLALARFVTFTKERGADETLIIIDNMERLRNRRSTDDFIFRLDEARKGLPVGCVLMGNEDFILPAYHGAEMLPGRFTRRAAAPSIKSSLDRLSDLATFTYADVSNEDIRKYVAWSGYDTALGDQICELRRFRRLRPSFPILDQLLEALSVLDPDEPITDDLIDTIIALPPPSRQAA